MDSNAKNNTFLECLIKILLYIYLAIAPKFTWTGIFDAEFGMQTHIQSTPSKFLHTARIPEFCIIRHVCIYI